MFCWETNNHATKKKYSLSLMKTESSLPHPQQRDTGPYEVLSSSQSQTTFLLSWLGSPAGPGRPLWLSSIALRHTTVGRAPLDEWSARLRELYLTTHDAHKRQTSMLAARYKPAIPASDLFYMTNQNYHPQFDDSNWRLYSSYLCHFILLLVVFSPHV